MKNAGKQCLPFYWDRFGTFTTLMLLILVLALSGPPQFTAPSNLFQIAIQSSITIIIACGEFSAVLIAGIGLSVDSIMALAGMVTARLVAMGNVPWETAVLTGLLVGTTYDIFNGMLINVTRLHPFVATLGTQSIFRGLVLIFSDTKSVYGPPQQFKGFMGGWLGGKVPNSAIIALIMAVLLWSLSSRTVLRRNIYALGGGKETAWFPGISMKLYILIVYIISGVYFGLAGIVYTARIGLAEPLAERGYETFAIASAIIGGTGFFGGRRQIPTAVIGGLIIDAISNGLNMLGVSSYYQRVATGSLIIIAVFLDRMFRGKASK